MKQKDETLDKAADIMRELKRTLPARLLLDRPDHCVTDHEYFRTGDVGSVAMHYNESAPQRTTSQYSDIGTFYK